MENTLKVGDRIYQRDWKDLIKTKDNLVKHGCHVEVKGFADMSDNILTVTYVPEVANEA